MDVSRSVHSTQGYTGEKGWSEVFCKKTLLGRFVKLEASGQQFQPDIRRIGLESQGGLWFSREKNNLTLGWRVESHSELLIEIVNSVNGIWKTSLLPGEGDCSDWIDWIIRLPASAKSTQCTLLTSHEPNVFCPLLWKILCVTLGGEDGSRAYISTPWN